MEIVHQSNTTANLLPALISTLKIYSKNDKITINRTESNHHNSINQNSNFTVNIIFCRFTLFDKIMTTDFLTGTGKGRANCRTSIFSSPKTTKKRASANSFVTRRTPVIKSVGLTAQPNRENQREIWLTFFLGLEDENQEN